MLTTTQASFAALLPNGTVRSWGNNEIGQLGDSSYTDSSVPVTVSNSNNARSIIQQSSGASSHMCVIR